MGRDIELEAVHVANLRGFRDAYLPLQDGLTLLVGPNNSGKTSVLRLLDWIVNEASEQVLLGEAPLTLDELRLLMPARETRNAARRLTLEIRVLDGRRHRRFQCTDGVATLRVGLTLPANLRLNVGPPRRNEASDSGAALELLRELRRDLSFSLVAASRDAHSDGFRDAFREAVLAKLEARATHSGGGGAPAEYRKVKQALNQIRDVADGLIGPIWQEVQQALPPGMATDASVSTRMDPPSLVKWIAEGAEFRISTGEHDSATVEPQEVGSGLQSLLELAFQEVHEEPADVDRIVALEEPEAFLHPAAQRTLARMIASSDSGRRVVSTHSPILVEEATFGEVVLVREHRFFPPSDRDDDVRQQINTALLSGYGAELAFARSVLLVEGPGDRAYYEIMRRRLARASGDGRVDQLTVIPVGSKSSFAPWLRLLSSFGIEGDRPVDWLVVADGDAATQVRRAWANADLRLPLTVRRLLLTAASERHNTDPVIFTIATNAVNLSARKRGVRLHLSPIDVEHAALMDCSDDDAGALADTLGLVATNRAELEVGVRNRKAPHLRAALASSLEWPQVSTDTRQILRRWLAPVMTTSEASALVRTGD